MNHEIFYHKNGNKRYEEYHINNLWHNENGPAIIRYYQNGNKMYEEFYINGNLHNTNGPAVIKYNENGEIEYKHYYLNFKKIDVKCDEELKKYIKLLNIL